MSGGEFDTLAFVMSVEMPQVAQGVPVWSQSGQVVTRHRAAPVLIFHRTVPLQNLQIVCLNVRNLLWKDFLPV
jgi:hypothetical protein